MSKSKGHICFLPRPHSSVPWEYFRCGSGALWRAPADCVIDLNTGYRCGARLEAPSWMAEQALADARRVFGGQEA